MTDYLQFINEILWGSIMDYLLPGAGIWFTFRSKLIQFRHFLPALALLKPGPGKDKRVVSPYQALCTSLAARIGSGNIAGVAIAITAGGPGAIFWMWVMALLGMATTCIESTLAQLYKTRDEQGRFIGGPAWYMERGLGMRWLGVLFSCLLVLACGFIFNTVQANSIARSMTVAFGLSPLACGLLLVLLTAIVIAGGVRYVVRVSQWLVPVMLLVWILTGIVIIALHIHQLPDIILLIFRNAFGWHEAVAGTMGYTLSQVMNSGIQRGLFSNEAGVGTSPNAAAMATPWPPHPASQGIIQMLGVFIDTFVICTTTAVIILCSGLTRLPTKGIEGVILAQNALSVLTGSGGIQFIAIMIFFFAWTSIIANYAYAENSLRFFGKLKREHLLLLRALVLCMVLFGALAQMPFVWQLADIIMALLAITNLSAILLLSPVASAVISDYLRQCRLRKAPEFDASRFPELQLQLDSSVWEKRSEQS